MSLNPSKVSVLAEIVQVVVWSDLHVAEVEAVVGQLVFG